MAPRTPLRLLQEGLEVLAMAWQDTCHQVARSGQPALFPRGVLTRIRGALGDTPVVMVKGPRQAGKSTLALELIRSGFEATYVTLDDPIALAPALRDPDAFVASFEGPVVIDEVQHVPDLFRAIKLAVDRRRRPGRFLLTGSADVLLLPKVSESLAGRLEVVTLWPLSQSEIERAQGGLVDALFAAPAPSIVGSEGLRAATLRRALRGGFPDAVRRDGEARQRWVGAYLSTMLQRDVRDLSQIEGLAALPMLLALIAARAASILNMSELARAVDLPYRTLVRYVALLEAIFFVRRIPAWSRGLGGRITRHPKVVLVDTGVAAHLQNVELARLQRDETLAGPIVENFVAMELMKQLEWSRTMPALYHFRDAAAEVDLVLERLDGTLVGVEVKAGASVSERELRGLTALAAAAGPKFHRGIVLYTGRTSIDLAPRIRALPINALWQL